jgi:aldoxime dehydratase
MESAIPLHLQRQRTRHRRISDDYNPPYPSIVARFDPTLTQVVMAYFGVQYTNKSDSNGRMKALKEIVGAFGSDRGPASWDRATYVDEAGFSNMLSVGYWRDPDDFDGWFERHGAGWAAGAGAENIGTFTEIVRPTAERFETLFSSNTAEGVANLAHGFSDLVQEHAYWGGARDRIPLSQADAMTPIGNPKVVGQGTHFRVIPCENVCLIRSGQDWSGTEGEQRRMYLEDVEPVLRAGMDYLRDEGREIGCFANRYMTLVDRDGKALEKSYGMSWWRSLADLERWAESHPTHLAIFGAAMNYLRKVGAAAQLKLYHEVTVAAASEQYFEYCNCHSQTGMLAIAGPS